ncbi:MAG TPA: hypothetical protein VF574_01880 [Allosphingosinicella sp.]
MESNERYYARRAGEEWRAVERALTPAAKARHRELAEAFQLKALECGGIGGRETRVSPAGFEPATC